MMCDVCIDKFNKTTRRPILCTSCGCNVCVECTKRYLLSSMENAHCMGCRKEWDRRFLVMELPKSFINKEYKKHRQNILLQRQIALLPSTTIFIEEEADLERRISKALDNFNIDASKIEKESRGTRRSTLLCNLTQTYQSAFHTWAHEINYSVGVRKRDFALGIYREFSGQPVVEDDTKLIETEQYVERGSCTRSECDGLIIKGWICTKCERKKCKKCYEPEDVGHICKEEDIAAVNTIRKESKPCPSCRIRIQRSEGCPQMFCTNCYTFFDYGTGKKLDPKISHNPEHQRLVREGRIANNNRTYNNGYHGLSLQVQRLIRWQQEFHDYAENIYQKNIMKYVVDSLDLRILKLRGEIENEHWKKRAQEIEKKMFYHRDAYELSLTFANTIELVHNQPCFYLAANILSSEIEMKKLQERFQQMKDELCSWYGFKKRHILARARQYNRGVVASYN